MQYDKSNTVIIMATGQSLTKEIVDSVKGWDVIAVNNAYEICPTAKYLVAQDRAWWKVNRSKVNEIFHGIKYSTHSLPDVKIVNRVAGMEKSSNSSAVLALFLAAQLGYKRAILLGVDCYGTHFFGAHKPPLKNTKPARFEVFQQQFEKAKKSLPNMKIVNCTIGTKLRTIDLSTLEQEGIVNE